MDFSDRVVLVTGSTSGIGERVAERFAALGARVAINSSSSVDTGRELASRLGGIYCRANVAVEAEVTAMVDEVVESLGGLDIVVNNAGKTHFISHDDLDAVTDDVWNDILGVNLLGTWYVTRAAVPHLRESDNGSVINITSLAGTKAVGSSVPYAVSKAGLNHMTRLLARALAPAVRVNAVAPGLVITPWSEGWSEMQEIVAANAPMRRAALPEDVADACLYLAASDFVTGDVLAVDGGHQLV